MLRHWQIFIGIAAFFATFIASVSIAPDSSPWRHDGTIDDAIRIGQLGASCIWEGNREILEMYTLNEPLRDRIPMAPELDACDDKELRLNYKDRNVFDVTAALYPELDKLYLISLLRKDFTVELVFSYATIEPWPGEPTLVSIPGRGELRIELELTYGFSSGDSTLGKVMRKIANSAFLRWSKTMNKIGTGTGWYIVNYDVNFSRCEFIESLR